MVGWIVTGALGLVLVGMLIRAALYRRRAQLGAMPGGDVPPVSKPLLAVGSLFLLIAVLALIGLLLK
jgi:hypothetical protein